MGLKVLSLNVKGLRDSQKVSKVNWYVSQICFDILFLQETHVVSLVEGNGIADKLSCRGSWGFGGPHSCGVAILVKKYLNVIVSQESRDRDGRYLILDFSFKGQEFRVVNVYLPNSVRERRLVLQELHNGLNSNRVTVCGGDFNFVEDLRMDKLGGDSLAGDGGAQIMRAIRSGFSLVDAFRVLHPGRRL